MKFRFKKKKKRVIYSFVISERGRGQKKNPNAAKIIPVPDSTKK